MIDVKEELKRKIDELPDEVAEFLLKAFEEIIEDYYALKIARERKTDETLSYEEAVRELKEKRISTSRSITSLFSGGSFLIFSSKVISGHLHNKSPHSISIRTSSRSFLP
ncbi:MAG: hypothetical protein J7L52_09110 [Thermotogae bacterium]|nr:hypothetical protein [Thermotogota bacterium]